MHWPVNAPSGLRDIKEKEELRLYNIVVVIVPEFQYRPV